MLALQAQELHKFQVTPASLSGHCSMMRTNPLLQSWPCAMLSISRLRFVLTFVFWLLALFIHHVLIIPPTGHPSPLQIFLFSQLLTPLQHARAETAAFPLLVDAIPVGAALGTHIRLNE